jgi:hypothetical protein
MRLEPGTAGSPHICSPRGLLKPKQIPHCSSSVGASRFYLLLYVDDIILTASSTTLLRCTIFCCTTGIHDEGPHAASPLPRHYCRAPPDGMFLHQRTYKLDIIKRVAMADCKSCTTPVDLQAKLAVDSEPPVQDASQF